MSEAKVSKGPLITQRRFAPLFVLLQTGTFNDNALKNSLIALITFGGIAFLSDLPSAIRVPVAAFIFTGPFLLICAIAGQIADKYDRGHILRWVKRAELVIMLIAGIGFWFVNVKILALALGLMGAQSAFFSPTKNAVLPQWLTDKELITGNALLNGFVFVFILIGQVVGTLIVLKAGGPKIVACMLFALAKAFEAPAVLRPMLGIAWFYGLSTIFITTFPDYIASEMRFDANVLIAILVTSTISILIGSLLTMMVAKWKIWGPEAVGLSALGITGVTVFASLLYLIPSPTFTGGGLGTAAQFFDNPRMPLFLGVVMCSSIFSGLFVVPLQAMAQRRADPDNRARLMSAGAVLLNLFVNVTTFALIAMAAKNMPPKSPFLIIIAISFFVAIYAIWRTIKPHHYVSHAGES